MRKINKSLMDELSTYVNIIKVLNLAIWKNRSKKLFEISTEGQKDMGMKKLRNT
jgi:hypothetical protein